MAVGGRDDRAVTRGRGAASNPQGRFESRSREAFDDGYDRPDDEIGTPPLKTTLHVERARTIIARNESPDIPFTQSINPYRGCEHGCIYCYARPSHAYLNLSPGLDFETQLFYKPNAAALLEAELRKPGYRCSVISLGANTDPYQPIERELGITRSLLEVMARFRQPVGIVTKAAALIERDIDLLQDLARDDLVNVALSITTLRPELKRTLEPRAASGAARLRTLRRLADAGIPTMVMFSPVIPFVNDAELEAVLGAARDAGARRASYIMMRLPYEVKDLFREWLELHFPQRAAHVMSLVRQMRGGRDNDPQFGQRMTGEGEYAAVIAQRFRLAAKRFGLIERDGFGTPLRCDAFRVPPQAGDQLSLTL
ncbi:PA0069 family radical SAM protein [Solimonas marina]|uniref:PA0069 family radical SAM protein n=1 Tax=Solimonas marina TaxID=2714601 RepID=A0A970B4S2_9GAMM|nr:PA0069 family radical SAM protein [Solimonas marina]NKF22627.1 PA0069 family radical SAM protein [Solimonas marina]